MLSILLLYTQPTSLTTPAPHSRSYPYNPFFLTSTGKGFQFKWQSTEEEEVRDKACSSYQKGINAGNRSAAAGVDSEATCQVWQNGF